MRRPSFTLLFAAECFVLVVCERFFPLRDPIEPKLPHDARNAVLAALAALPSALLEAPIAEGLARRARAHRTGLLPALRLPPGVDTLLGVLALDYTLYHWHALTHRVPFLFRFHAVHHVDRDMDATTAVRFHFGEITLSVLFRATQIAVFGVTPQTYRLWQRLLLASIAFHHANVRLPLAWERRLALLLTTPRLHGIHHADRPAGAAANLSTGLALWDRLHRTYRDEASFGPVRIGLPAYRANADATLVRAIVQPFCTSRDPWREAAPPLPR